MHKHVQSILAKLKHHKILVAGIAIVIALIPVLIVIISNATINTYAKYILPNDTQKSHKVGLVLGAGISNDGKPYDELKARLDTAATALSNGQVNALVLSGDNRFVDYNEPEAMKRYLVDEKNVNEEKLVLDYAGRSTYESCERAAKIFEIKQVVLFSAQSHLPRAIYLCRHFGIEAFGIASKVEANNSTRRELLARVKALYNANILGENTVLGDPLPIRAHQ